MSSFRSAEVGFVFFFAGVGCTFWGDGMVAASVVPLTISCFADLWAFLLAGGVACVGVPVSEDRAVDAGAFVCADAAKAIDASNSVEAAMSLFMSCSFNNVRLSAQS